MWLPAGAKSWLQGRYNYLCWDHKKDQNNFCSTLTKMLQPIWSGPFAAGEISSETTTVVFFHTILLLSDVSGDSTETLWIHLMCVHTLYLPRKGCLPPLISMSSSRSSMHLTARPALWRNTALGKAWDAQYTSCTARLFSLSFQDGNGQLRANCFHLKKMAKLRKKIHTSPKLGLVCENSFKDS